jgi:hypothetical protein
VSIVRLAAHPAAEVKTICFPIDVRVMYVLPIDIRVERGTMGGKKQPGGEMVQGTLDMLILRTLVMGPAHGYTIAQCH